MSANSPRDEVRAELAQSKPRKSETITLPSGTKLDLRNLTLAQRRSVERDSKGDPTLALVFTVIEGTYVHGTDTQLWERADQAMLLGKECGDIVDRIFSRLMFMQAEERTKAEEAAGK